MSSKRSAATRRAEKQARAAAAGRSARRGRSGFWDTLGTGVLGGAVAMYVALFAAAIAESAGGAVLASGIAVLWALVLCVGAHRLGEDSRRPVVGPAREARWRDWAWLLLPAAVASPTATHWAAGRTRSGRLTFADADPALVDLAQFLGWVAVAVIVLGCPVAWHAGRRWPRPRHRPS